jgi:hypothetical protein
MAARSEDKPLAQRSSLHNDLRLQRTRPAELSITHIYLTITEQHTICCAKGIDCDSLSGTESQRDGANGRNDGRLV